MIFGLSSPFLTQEHLRLLECPEMSVSCMLMTCLAAGVPRQVQDGGWPPERPSMRTRGLELAPHPPTSKEGGEELNIELVAVSLRFNQLCLPDETSTKTPKLWGSEGSRRWEDGEAEGTWEPHAPSSIHRLLYLFCLAFPELHPL